MSAVLSSRTSRSSSAGASCCAMPTSTSSAGELVGLIGPNGAGKTTLLRTALGAAGAVGGRVKVDGRQAAPGASRSDTSRSATSSPGTSRSRSRTWSMTGRTGRLGLLRRPGVADWKAVDDALERVRMTDLRTRPVGELSGGQRQRVLVARALALRRRCCCSTSRSPAWTCRRRSCCPSCSCRSRARTAPC